MLPIRFCRSVAVLAIFSFCGPARIAFCQGATYPKIEASFNITGLATDPFDYTVTDVRVQITQPDCTTLSLPAFFDGGTTWRVRHTPAIGGRYSIAGVTLNGAPVSVSNLQPASWTVAGPPTDLGFVKIDPSNARRFITSNGKRFYPRGEDVAWSTSAANAVNIMPKMGLAHENWSRVWMTHFSAGSGLGLNLDWPKVNNTFGQLSLPVAANWDAIVAAAEQSGLHFQMTLQHHGQYSTTTDANWSSNPYNTALGGFLANPTNFFTDATAKALTKRKLRYAVARWGYSTSLMAWELFNEVQFTDAANAHQWTVIQAWHNEMAAFLRSQDSYQHLITTSSVLNQPIWDQTDYYQHHDYPSAPSIISGLRNATDITGSQPVRPDFGGECGTNGTPHLGVNAPIWAGLMAGQSGNEMPWYWDGIDAANDYIYFRAMSDFVTVSGLGDQDVLTKSAPAVTTSPGGLLSAYAVGNTNFEALYVWSPNNVFNPSASTTAAGTLSVSGLNPGTYSASWWDTFAGVVISNFTVTVPDANPVSVNTPAILRSAALYVGLPPQAGITAPVLTQTVGTNSPAFSFPITLANSGGLPLGYSLSITGASPVLYTAINSTQPGGPTFVWKDISAVGFDIVTNFTALAAPKTARDEGIAGPIDIGFAFPFFSGSQTPALFTQLYVSANGYVAFSPFGGDTSTNTVLPNSLAPSNCIAFFWDDLDLGNSFTHVYIAQDLIAQTFTVEFQNARIKGTFVNVTCQLVLKSTGEILIQYLAASSATSSCTVGVQNAAGDQGLTVAFNQSFVQPNMAIRLTPTPWLSFSSSAGYVPPSKSETVTVALNAGGLAAGTYSATILVNTTDSLQPVTATRAACSRHCRFRSSFHRTCPRHRQDSS